MRYHLTSKSANEKTGPIPVSTTSKDSCPSSCPFISNGCYAKLGPLGWHWNKVSDGRNPNTTDMDGLTAKVRAFPEGQVWRHNQAGDLPGVNEQIDRKDLNTLVDANRGKRGFTYTHKPMTPDNAMAVRTANRDGFTINLSANTLAQVDEYKALNVAPIVVTLPSDAPMKQYTKEGHRVIVCPAQRSNTVTCASCKLCAITDRKVIIGFLAHGSQAKRVNEVSRG